MFIVYANTLKQADVVLLGVNRHFYLQLVTTSLLYYINNRGWLSLINASKSNILLAFINMEWQIE